MFNKNVYISLLLINLSRNFIFSNQKNDFIFDLEYLARYLELTRQVVS